jgi:beta-lactam-binding protein with PASTA domain
MGDLDNTEERPAQEPDQPAPVVPPAAAPVFPPPQTPVVPAPIPGGPPPPPRQPPPLPAPPAPPAKKKSRLWLWIVIAIVAVLVIAAIVLVANLFGGGSEVPNLAGLSLSDATTTLDKAGLELGEVVYTTELPAGAKDGEVVGQLPPAGEQVDKGTKVDVIVARSAQTATVPNVVGMTSDEAAKSLSDAGFTAKPVSVESDADKGTVVDQSPKAGATAATGSEVTVMVSAGKQQTLVPNVVGKTEEDATSTLTAAGYKAQTKSEYNEKVEKGLVASQSPAGGTAADAGTTVTIVVSQGKNPNVTVPDVVGMTQDDATSALTAAGYKVKVQTSYDEKVEKGLVVSQSPAGGTAADAGTTVTILVSQGKNPTVTVPNVVGMTETDAGAALSDAGLEPVPSSSYSDTVPAGTVISQDPAAGKSVTAGSPVSYAVSQGPKPPDTATVPPVVGKTEDEATTALQQAGYKAAVSRAYSDSVAKDVVAAQAPQGGVVTQPGITVGLLVSDGQAPGPDFVVVPDLRAMTLDQATAALQALGLTVTSYEAFTDLQPDGQVFAQLPPPGYEVAPGVAVTVLVSKGPQPQVNPQ